MSSAPDSAGADQVNPDRDNPDRNASRVRSIRTVLGDVDATTVGDCLMHEHVLFDIVPPGTSGDRDAPIELGTRWQINYRSNEHPNNAHQQDVDVAGAEVRDFVETGGSLIVDQSIFGLARDPHGLRQVSRASGAHIVACAGTYTAPYLDTATCTLDTDELTDRFVNEVSIGLDGTNVCAGLIGEIGCSWPLEPIERRALSAAARASQRTGAAISVHPGRHPDAAAQIVEQLDREGADIERVVICHMDRTYPDGQGVGDVLALGVNVEWDFFGVEQSHYWMGDVELPTDRGRLRQIRELADAGHAKRLFLSQDICTKTRLLQWGGHGYGHLLRNVKPLMRLLGFDEPLIETLLRTNPCRLLTLEPSIT